MSRRLVSRKSVRKGGGKVKRSKRSARARLSILSKRDARSVESGRRQQSRLVRDVKKAGSLYHGWINKMYRFQLLKQKTVVCLYGRRKSSTQFKINSTYQCQRNGVQYIFSNTCESDKVIIETDEQYNLHNAKFNYYVQQGENMYTLMNKKFFWEPWQEIKKYRWGTPLINSDVNKVSFKIFNELQLITNTHGDPWFYKLPADEINDVGNNDALQLKVHHISRKIEILLNSSFFPLLKEGRFPVSQDAIFFNRKDGGFRSTLSVSPFQFNDTEISFLSGAYNYIRLGGNPVTRVAIFCSMVKLMISFLKTDGEYLLWMQQKANIVHDIKFKQLVCECSIKFDVTWLWTVNSRCEGISTIRIADSQCESLSDTGLKYEIGESRMTRGNTAVLMKRSVVMGFLHHICASSNDNCPVDMFREDVTLERFVKNTAYRTATVFEQDGHPIEYVDSPSSYHKYGGV